MSNRLRESARGFTLIELAIVIVIAGILAAIALPIYQGIVRDSKWAEADTALGAIAGCMGVHHSRNGGYDVGLTVGMDGTQFGPVIRLQLDNLYVFAPTDFTLTAVAADTFTVQAQHSLGEPPGIHQITETSKIVEIP